MERETALVGSIQKFSTEDGPGIRTSKAVPFAAAGVITRN